MKRSFVACLAVFVLLGNAVMAQAQQLTVDEAVSSGDGADEIIVGPGGENPVAVAELRAMTLKEYASDIAQHVVDRIERINERMQHVPPVRRDVPDEAGEVIRTEQGTDDPHKPIIEPFPVPAPRELVVPSVNEVKMFVYLLMADLANGNQEDIDFATVTVGEYSDTVGKHILDQIAGLNDLEKRLLGIWMPDEEPEAQLLIMANRVAHFVASETDCEFTRPVVETVTEDSDTRVTPAPKPEQSRARGGMFFCPALQKGS